MLLCFYYYSAKFENVSIPGRSIFFMCILTFMQFFKSLNVVLFLIKSVRFMTDLTTLAEDEKQIVCYILSFAGFVCDESRGDYIQT